MRKLSLMMAVAIVFLTVFICPAYATNYVPDFDVTSETVYLENLDTGAVVYEKNASARVYPASLTKIMTAIVVLEHVKDLDAETAEYPLYIQDLLYGTNASLGGLIVGEKLSIRNLLYSALVQSANESAMILADYVGSGSISTFVDMMNAKAAELGCTGTHYTNPTGLHNENHYTTAHDMALLTKYAMQNDLFSEIVSTYAYDIGPTNKHDTLMQYSTNRMLIPSSPYYYGPIVGVKTGSTDEAGHCLISEAVSDGYHYLCVMMGSPTTATETYVNFTETRQLYKWVFNNFSLVTLQEQGELMAEVPVKYSSDGKTAQLVTQEDVIQLLNDSVSTGSVQYFVEVPEYVEAPVKAGDVVGTLHLKLADEELGTVNLVASKDFSLSWFKKVLGTIGELLSSTVAKIIFVVVILAVGGYIYLMIRHNRKKRRRRRFANRQY